MPATVPIPACFPDAPGDALSPAEAAALQGIQARAIGEGDMAFLLALYGGTRAREMDAVGWPPAVRHAFLSSQFELQHRHYQAKFPRADFLLLLRAGVPIGRFYWQAGADRAHLIEVTLLPAERGAGLGSALLALLAAQADARGLAVHLHVDRSNPARRWYARRGFLEAAHAAAQDPHGFHVPMVRPAAPSRRCESAAL